MDGQWRLGSANGTGQSRSTYRTDRLTSGEPSRALQRWTSVQGSHRGNLQHRPWSGVKRQKESATQGIPVRSGRRQAMENEGQYNNESESESGMRHESRSPKPSNPSTHRRWTLGMRCDQNRSLDCICSPKLDATILTAIKDCPKCKNFGPTHIHSLLELITRRHPFELLVGDYLSLPKGTNGYSTLGVYLDVFSQHVLVFKHECRKCQNHGRRPSANLQQVHQSGDDVGWQQTLQ